MSVETKFYLDSSNLEHIQRATQTGIISGVTTNPSNFALTLVEQGMTGLSRDYQETLYLDRVSQIHDIVHGPVSAQVPFYRDSTENSVVEKALHFHSQLQVQGVEHYIKLITNRLGIKAAHILSESQVPLNMTLIAIPDQLKAVYIATKGNPNVVASIFIRRLYDPPKEARLERQNGMDLISHGVRLYSKGDGHVKVLAASIGDTDDIKEAEKIGADIITIPFPIFEKWQAEGFRKADENFVYLRKGSPIPFNDLSLKRSYIQVSTPNIITILGEEAFRNDWEKPLAKP